MRLAAIARITNQGVLTDIAQHDRYIVVREAAIERITNPRQRAAILAADKELSAKLSARARAVATERVAAERAHRRTR